MSSNITPSHHSSLQENFAEVPVEEPPNMEDFFKEDRQIKDVEMLRKGNERTLVNKYNEVVVSSALRLFASKYGQD